MEVFLMKNNKKQIVIIANPSIPLPPANYGGAERIIDCLNNALHSSNYSLHIIAAVGSSSYGGKLYTYFPSGNKILRRIIERLRFYFISLKVILDADLIINHGRVDYLLIFFLSGKKIINVFHNPISQQEVDYLFRKATNIFPIALSLSQIDKIDQKDKFTVIPNGIKTNLLLFNKISPREYFVFIGRMTKEKGIDKAIAIAIKMKIVLKIAGPIPQSESIDYQFYKNEVLPYFNDTTIVYVGNITDIQKNEFFSGAIAFLFPLVGPEAFGLTVIESLSCGVPIICSDQCALSEIVDHGRTGFLCIDDDDYYSAVGKVNQLNNQYCRDQAILRFDQHVMNRNYIKLVETILLS